MQIKYKDQTYEAEKIIKKDNTISGYDEGQAVFTITGVDEKEISGEYIEEVTDKRRLEVLEQAMLEILMGGM